ncbi:MAG: guanosine monophosphate reductase [Candidatus Wildermuthbacteria bacterium RIFCSPHIGHO2_12_FULL_45_9]|uniref:Guanosine monophosphate reductase n=1 Tax=Candidatus Wildermuthbacteria bacterium RIFCSPHIGHO2_02_FULL_45_25 TaxID=1802450 RepID=A0A1G2R2N1_9BACT|nr:MAG: guanosine monophosphate reductase [Candidatus Wildermuthbacteria bacterium RIFCSPHIGHO2_01_FULL_45_20]OHA67144.1 MAG: guanosine monophosphate reductase [Candidatus Wildermuthbacteria bacterium RIFCSPHIGHO2_02_FULL_45_25]OHA71429.1 MAG: guanosine monophosphate reductase [Candidatus Wildermuthbacteria bacterium RIFCSPHIGHO2_12_FULL_45_9]
MRSIPLGLTFDDVLLIPQESNVRQENIVFVSRFTKHLTLSLPVSSAIMDTVTETEMAIAMAKEGGIGIIHRNCTIDQQVAMVKKAKKVVGNLPVGAGIGPNDLERAQALDEAGADVISFDCAHAHKQFIVENVRKLKKTLNADLIVGNIATTAAAKALLPYADALKVGIGPGSICTTRIMSGVGVPQLTAIMEVAKIASIKKIPVIADGGIRYSGDIVKALAAGAESVMLGSMLAGTKETPGKIVQVGKNRYKQYRGMGSEGAMKTGSADRYAQSKEAKKYVPEGVEALTPYKGPVANVLFQIQGGLRAGMGYVGAATIQELQDRAEFIRITQAGRAESHPHSIVISKEAPNYKSSL